MGRTTRTGRGESRVKRMAEVLTSFLAIKTKEEPDSVGLGVSAPQANAYEFQSSGVVDM